MLGPKSRRPQKTQLRSISVGEDRRPVVIGIHTVGDHVDRPPAGNQPHGPAVGLGHDPDPVEERA